MKMSMSMPQAISWIYDKKVIKRTGRSIHRAVVSVSSLTAKTTLSLSGP